jgi:hypothetical protein
VTASPGTAYSQSVQLALDWASAVARVRQRTPPTGTAPEVDPSDLFIGALLSHPDQDGELRVLLTHFGLTARDVVGERYAAVNPAALARAVAQVSPGTQSADGPGLSDIFRWALSHASDMPQLLHVIGGMLAARTALLTPLDDAFADVGESRQAVAASYEQWLSTSPEKQGVAGKLLRDWLQERNPRSPVSVAGFSSDDVAAPDFQQPDLIGISPEANALAYLVASVDLAPPLAVGLFGDWGSGKSFLMRDVQARIERIVQLATGQLQHQAAVWKNIKPIEFNAWEYVQGDLWAALLERIFEKLGPYVKTPSLVESRKAPVQERLNVQNDAVKQAKDRRVALEQQQTALTKKVEDAAAALAAEQNEAERQKEAFEASAAEAVKTALGDLYDEELFEPLGDDLGALLGALGELRQELLTGWRQLRPYWRDWKQGVLVAAVALGFPIVTLLITIFGGSRFAALTGGITAAVTAATASLARAADWMRKRNQRVAKAQAEVLARMQLPVQKAERELAAARQDLATVEVSLAAAQAVVATETAQARAMRAELEALTAGRVFTDFAAARSADYRSVLGLMARAREDLKVIEGEIARNNINAINDPAEFDPAVPNRIVLYIDDLDRCPPAKVVQVLEAVHLLLAFRLFVVFVAVDSRWLSSALLEELHALKAANGTGAGAPADTPTARDYLEKIFQLPFWVQPVLPEDRGKIVSGLLADSVRTDGDGGAATEQAGLHMGNDQNNVVEEMLIQTGSGLRLETSALSLSPAELAFMTSLGPLLGDTPRRVKRFVNTVQLLLSVRPPLSGDGERPPRQAVALYAAIREAAPALARLAFAPEYVNTPLSDVLNNGDFPAAERDAIKKWLDSPANDSWKQVTSAVIGERCKMVQRIGFDKPIA